MNYSEIPRLIIGKIKAKIPIIQGGMSVGISLAGLASAVATMGGIGIIGAAGIGMLEPDYVT
ncbi:MAG: nitronate monooxygenase, partial [Planctomycetes bacterium]|nr:nitronate monooxygenase [Planctomycetota bacterium]